MNERQIKEMRRSELLEKLLNRDRIIAGLKGKVERLEKRNIELLDKIDDLKTVIERMEKKLDAKDAELENMSRQLEETYKRMARKLETKENRIQELKASLLLRDGGDEPTEEADEAKPSGIKLQKKKSPAGNQQNGQ